MVTFKVDYLWKIDNFKSFLSQKTEKFSPKFFVADHDIMFCFRIHHSKNDNASVNIIDLYLFCFPGKTIRGGIPITFELGFLKNDGSFVKQEISYTFDGKTISVYGKAIFGDYSKIMNPSNHFLHGNHQLQVRCKATVSYNKHQSQFSSDLVALLDSGDFSDINILVNGTKIPAHKSILSARSPIFKAMFSYDNTKEALENEVAIPDVSVSVMKEFLRFIYTGVKTQGNQYCSELLAVADKYQVDDLKLYCQDQLSSLLKVENVVEVFLKADLYNAAILKEKCLLFISSNFKEVVMTKDWEQMCKSGGEKMIEVSRFVGKYS